MVSAPPVGNVNGNVGTFDPMNVSVGSELVLSLTQTQNGSQILVQRLGSHDQRNIQLWDL